jgi:hypothetical protein
MRTKADVVIFVRPVSADAATIGVAYRKVVPHTRVKADLANLLNSTGWKYAGNLVMNDASTHPEDLKRFPPTTAAMLDVANSPQVRNGAPELLPYLQTFQAYSHVEVNFAVPDINPYTGVQHFDSAALSVELHKDEGVYRYETEIRDHQRPLPQPVEAPGAAQQVQSDRARAGAPITKPVPTGSNRLSLALLLAGSVLLVGGVSLYLLTNRRVPVRAHAQTTHGRSLPRR